MSYHAAAAAKSSSYGHDQGGRRREEPGWPARDEGSYRHDSSWRGVRASSGRPDGAQARRGDARDSRAKQSRMLTTRVAGTPARI